MITMGQVTLGTGPTVIYAASRQTELVMRAQGPEAVDLGDASLTNATGAHPGITLNATFFRLNLSRGDALYGIIGTDQATPTKVFFLAFD